MGFFGFIFVPLKSNFFFLSFEFNHIKIKHRERRELESVLKIGYLLDSSVGSNRRKSRQIY